MLTLLQRTLAVTHPGGESMELSLQIGWWIQSPLVWVCVRHKSFLFVTLVFHVAATAADLGCFFFINAHLIYMVGGFLSFSIVTVSIASIINTFK